jgi:hypothetical protein
MIRVWNCTLPRAWWRDGVIGGFVLEFDMSVVVGLACSSRALRGGGGAVAMWC